VLAKVILYASAVCGQNVICKGTVGQRSTGLKDRERYVHEEVYNGMPYLVSDEFVLSIK
jgi:hypothetical protein